MLLSELYMLKEDKNIPKKKDLSQQNPKKTKKRNYHKKMIQKRIYHKKNLQNKKKVIMYVFV